MYIVLITWFSWNKTGIRNQLSRDYFSIPSHGWWHCTDATTVSFHCGAHGTISIRPSSVGSATFTFTQTVRLWHLEVTAARAAETQGLDGSSPFLVKDLCSCFWCQAKKLAIQNIWPKKQKPSKGIILIDCVEDPGIMEIKILPNNRPPPEKNPDTYTYIYIYIFTFEYTHVHTQKTYYKYNTNTYQYIQHDEGTMLVHS